MVVLVTCPSGSVARRLATSMVKQRLAACVNIVPRLQSVFRWRGKVEQATEALLIIKTTARRFPALARGIRAGHPYDVPEIIALPITQGSAPYLAWVANSVQPSIG